MCAFQIAFNIHGDLYAAVKEPGLWVKGIDQWYPSIKVHESSSDPAQPLPEGEALVSGGYKIKSQFNVDQFETNFSRNAEYAAQSFVSSKTDFPDLFFFFQSWKHF